MALHEKDKIKDRINDDVYAASDLSVVMPKYKMPEKEHDPRHAYQVVHDELMLDGNSRQNLATFCQTWLEPEVLELMALPSTRTWSTKTSTPRRRDRKTLRSHAGRSVELAGCKEHDRDVDYRLQRGGHAGRHGHAVELARQVKAAASPPRSRTW